MNLSYYTGNPRNKNQSPANTPDFKERYSKFDDPAGYLPGQALIDAVNVALFLNKPLLVTGEAGTGKTQLASQIAWELNFEGPFKFETKSTSTAKDLFYFYDTLARFHAAQTQTGSTNPRDYLTYNALGEAILLANNLEKVKNDLPKNFNHQGIAQRSVVLIDEIDKAPRDFPNDLLNEIEGMYFRIPELDNRIIQAERKLKPIVIITSNSEKHLPDAFLRRCVYYYIPFPDEKTLKRIIISRLGGESAIYEKVFEGALKFFKELRAPENNLNKKPATAELLEWLVFLKEHVTDINQPLNNQKDIMKKSLYVLAKTTDDLLLTKSLLNNWS